MGALFFEVMLNHKNHWTIICHYIYHTTKPQKSQHPYKTQRRKKLKQLAPVRAQEGALRTPSPALTTPLRSWKRRCSACFACYASFASISLCSRLPQLPVHYAKRKRCYSFAVAPFSTLNVKQTLHRRPNTLYHVLGC